MKGGPSPLFFTHPDCLSHEPNPEHPEKPRRLACLLEALGEPPLSLMEKRQAPEASLEDLALAHTRGHIDKTFDLIPKKGIWALDPDTIVSPGSGRAALRAAGAGIAAVDAILDGQADFAFCAVRPPGHHATASRPGGFCLFNNVAIAALHALERRRLSRVAVADFDVHHGNGTEAIFGGDGRVFFASTHDLFIYPGTGGAEGKPANILNVPLPSGSDGKAMRAAWEKTVLPRLAAHEPEMLFVSAGFDAHKDDPISSLAWETEDFGWLGEKIAAFAAAHCRNRVVAFLEGGYDIPALRASVQAFCGAFVSHHWFNEETG